jgi:thiamine biosynthesis lipoprotein ApbE
LTVTIRDAVQARIWQFDLTYSRFRPDSLVARVAQATGGGRYTFPGDAIALFDLYDRLVRATGGALDPLVATGGRRGEPAQRHAVRVGIEPAVMGRRAPPHP